MPSRRKRSLIWLLPEEEFRGIVEKSRSMTEALRCLGLANKGGNNRTFKERMISLNIPLDKFKEGGVKSRLAALTSNRLSFSDADVFVENSSYGRTHLKARIIKQSLLPYVCAVCGQLPTWNGLPLVLILDHLNGIYNDNRLDNLRFLCPNCNVQQATFAGRNNRRKEKDELSHQP